MFNHLMCDKVNIQRINGFDSYNNPVVEEEKTIIGKLEFETKNVVDKNGSLVVAMGELRCYEPINNDDLIEVNNVYKSVINVIPQTDFSGKVQYYVVYFGGD